MRLSLEILGWTFEFGAAPTISVEESEEATGDAYAGHSAPQPVGFAGEDVGFHPTKHQQWEDQ